MKKVALLVLLVPCALAFTPFHHQHAVKTPPETNTDIPPTLNRRESIQQTGLAIALASLLALTGAPDIAGAAKAKDISGQDFSGQDLSQRDFTGVIAKGTDFHNSNLQGSVFSSANLVNADFSGADLRGANFVDATLDGTKFKDAQAQKAVFSATILDAGDLENIDLTQSLWPSKLRIMICDMDELKGQNPVTGADSRDSIKCTDIMYKS